MLLPPEVICGPDVQKITWSSDGLYVAVVRTPNPLNANLVKDMLGGHVTPNSIPSLQTQLIVYPIKSKKAKLVAEVDASATQLEVEWLEGADKLLITQAPRDPAAASMLVSLYTASTGSSKVVLNPGPNHYVIASPSPVSPEVLFSVTALPVGAIGGQDAVVARPEQGLPAHPETSAYFMDSQGKLSAEFKLGKNLQMVNWTDQGKICTYTIKREPGKKSEFTWYQLDPATWQSTVLPKRPNFGERNETSDHFVVRNASFGSGKEAFSAQAPVILLYLKDSDNKSPGIVSTDGTTAVVSPTGTAVAFKNQGVAMVRELVSVPKEIYLEAKKAAEKAQAISQAKQVALAFIMCASDYDDVLPSNSSGWRDTIMPYIKNSDMVGAFNYTFAGGPAAKIESPAETVLGYIDGPGGRAVAYTDGHVKWIPNP